MNEQLGQQRWTGSSKHRTDGSPLGPDESWKTCPPAEELKCKNFKRRQREDRRIFTMELMSCMRCSCRAQRMCVYSYTVFVRSGATTLQGTRLGLIGSWPQQTAEA